jgi:hypothetical protein
MLNRLPLPWSNLWITLYMHPNALQHCECYASQLILIKPTATITILLTAPHSGVVGTPGGRLKISPEHRTFRVSRGFTQYPQNSKVVSQSRPRPRVLYVLLAFIAHSKEISGSHEGEHKKFYLLWCNTMYKHKDLPTFRRKWPSPYSGYRLSLEPKAATERYYKTSLNF